MPGEVISWQHGVNEKASTMKYSRKAASAPPGQKKALGGKKTCSCDFHGVYDIFGNFQLLPRCNFVSNYWSLPF